MFGSKKAADPYGPLSGFRPSGFTGGGLSATSDGMGGYSVSPTADRLALVDRIATQLGLQANEVAALRAGAGPEFEALRERLRTGVAALRAQNAADTTGLLDRNARETAAIRDRIAPGMSELRRVRLQEIEDARNRAVGNLRENMQQRRVLGSSFGQDALARAELEFGGAKERAAAESTLAEIEATRALDREAFNTDAGLMARRFGVDAELFNAAQSGDANLFLQKLEGMTGLINQEFTARRGQFQVALDDLNLQADIASKLAAGASTQLGAMARLEAELRAKEAAGEGKFFGMLGGKFGDAVGGKAGSWLEGLFKGGFGGGQLAGGDMGAFI